MLQKQLIDYEDEEDKKADDDHVGGVCSEYSTKVVDVFEGMTILEQLNAMRVMKEGPNWGMNDFYISNRKKKRSRKGRR